jgi:hypothetical protein
LQGSTRFELSPDERSVLIDLLCLAGDDDGFIRANPETTYPEPYLAHLLNIEVELLKRAVKKCVAVGKLTLMPDGILYVNSWKDYQLDPRRKREVMEGESPGPRIASSLNTNSPNTNSSRKENLDLDDTERSAFPPSHAASAHARPSDTKTGVYMGGIGPDCRVFDVLAGMAIYNILNTKEMRKWTN